MSALVQLNASTWVDLDQVESITTHRTRSADGAVRQVVLRMRSGDMHTLDAIPHGWQSPEAAAEGRSFNMEHEVDAELRRWLLDRIGLEHLRPIDDQEQR